MTSDLGPFPEKKKNEGLSPGKKFRQLLIRSKIQASPCFSKISDLSLFLEIFHAD